MDCSFLAHFFSSCINNECCKDVEKSGKVGRWQKNEDIFSLDNSNIRDEKILSSIVIFIIMILLSEKYENP